MFKIIILTVSTLMDNVMDNTEKCTPWFTRPQAILGVYDLFISDEYNQRFI